MIEAKLLMEWMQWRRKLLITEVMEAKLLIEEVKLLLMEVMEAKLLLEWR